MSNKGSERPGQAKAEPEAKIKIRVYRAAEGRWYDVEPGAKASTKKEK